MKLYRIQSYEIFDGTVKYRFASWITSCTGEWRESREEAVNEGEQHDAALRELFSNSKDK